MHHICTKQLYIDYVVVNTWQLPSWWYRKIAHSTRPAKRLAAEYTHACVIFISLVILATMRYADYMEPILKRWTIPVEIYKRMAVLKANSQHFVSASIAYSAMSSRELLPSMMS